MATGKVKWFDTQKGHGVIQMENGKEIFVHHKAIQGHRFESLKEGEMVEFEIRQGSEGVYAESVVKL